MAKIILIVIFFLVLFLVLSTQLRDSEMFKDSLIVQTGATVAENLNDNLKLDENLDSDKKTKDIGETANHNGLFKD